MELWSILSLNEEISKKNEVEGRGSMAGGCGIGSGGCWLVKKSLFRKETGVVVCGESGHRLSECETLHSPSSCFSQSRRNWFEDPI